MAPVTIGRHGPHSEKPRPRSASQSISPATASRPNTEPPDRTTPSTRGISPPGRSASVLTVPGAPPRTSAAASAGGSASTTVTPVRAPASSALPTSSPATSARLLRGPGRITAGRRAAASVASAMTLAEATRSSIATNSSG